MQKQNLNLRNKIRTGIAATGVLLVGSIVFVVPQYVNKGIDMVNNKVHTNFGHIAEKPFRLGLDLKGGAHLVYQADVKNIPAGDQASAVEGVRQVIERRVNAFGVSESVVQTSKVGENYQLIVELPGVTDTNAAIRSIGETPILEFKEQNNEPPREMTAEEKKSLETFNATAKKKTDEALLEMKKGLSFEDAVKKYSEDEASKNNNGYLGFTGKYGKYPEMSNWAKTAKEGQVSITSIQSNDGYNIVKRGKEKDGESEFKASHILICYFGAQGCDGKMTKDEAKAKADELFKQATDKNFAALAKANSTDPGSKENGGDLGLIAPGMLVRPFEDALKTAQVGQIVGPVETEFGYHLIYKTGEEKLKEYEISRILVKTKSSADFLPVNEPWKSTTLSGKQLKRAEVVTDQNTGAVQVSLQFDDEGSKLFQELTARNIGKPVAIFLDKEPISIPTVNTEISGGKAVITGNFTLQEAKLLSQRLNTGALPVPVELVSQQTVGATLGIESLQKSLVAGVIGFLLIMAFMILYYRLPGVIAVLALTLYVALTLSVFKLLGITLTLAGITGFILSIGIAVDANVLIFERMKEELRSGKALRTSIEEGFTRAWSSIRDGNTSTLITCFLLVMMGTGFVKGFAITLIIGILVSLFTAITVTRILLRFVAPWFNEKGNALFLGAKKE
jgi:protein-export membrane protein SecD